MIYFDNASTTPMYKELMQVINDNLSVANPSSTHRLGIEAKTLLNDCRKRFAKLLGADAGEIIFTSSGTESNNTALFGSGLKKGDKIIISAAEHSSVYYSAKQMQNTGYSLALAPVDGNGKVIIDEFKRLLDDKVGLVSIMHVNNETGAVNEIKEIVKAVRNVSDKTIIHCDGVQAVGKFKINLHALGVDCYSVSAHKFNAMKGVGALYIKNGTRLKPLIYGGGQERGMRSATENVIGIACMVKALEIFTEKYDAAYIENLAEKFLNGLCGIAPDVLINSDIRENPNIISVALKNLRGEILLNILSDNGVMAATGSACASNNANDRIAASLGLSNEYSKGMLRISFSMDNTVSEVDMALKALHSAIKFLQ